jgi:hypothetical protein
MRCRSAGKRPLSDVPEARHGQDYLRVVDRHALALDHAADRGDGLGLARTVLIYATVAASTSLAGMRS